MLKENKLVQPEKAEEPMNVTLLGMVTEVKPVQYLKAPSPMDVMLLGMLTEVRLEQPEYLQVALFQLFVC